MSRISGLGKGLVKVGGGGPTRIRTVTDKVLDEGPGSSLAQPRDALNRTLHTWKHSMGTLGFLKNKAFFSVQMYMAPKAYRVWSFVFCFNIWLCFKAYLPRVSVFMHTDPDTRTLSLSLSQV